MISTEVKDQAWHFGVGYLIGILYCSGALVTLIAGPFFGALYAVLGALCCGLIREFTEAGGSRIELEELEPLLTKRDFYLDIAFWSAAGVGLVLTVWIFRGWILSLLAGVMPA